IEGFRSDSLYLYVGHIETDIKISQLVSVFAIIFGVLTLTKIYRKQLHALYKKMFKSDYDEVSKSRWILIAVSAAFIAAGIVMCVLCANVKAANGKGGESYLIAGVILLALGVYSALGVWSLFDRLKIYCRTCKQAAAEPSGWQTDYERLFTATVCYGVIMGALLAFGLFSLIAWGIIARIPNGTVLFVACAGCIVAIALGKFVPSLKQLLKTEKTPPISACDCQCGGRTEYRLNKFLLFVFPPKVYLDYGVENLKPYVEEKPEKKKRVRKADK
ncbi:MAG: hypothetical protein NC099_06330, partial [Corallococcus sp.]|nr:hypothetical protein [Corallococcus sp.]